MKGRSTGAWTLTALGGILALVLILSRAVAAELVYPVERAAMLLSQRVWTRLSGALHSAEANAENVRLRRELAALSFVRDELDRLEAENVRLRKALDYAAAEPVKWLPACVLSSEGASAGVRRSLRVGRGSLDGIAIGAVVAVPEGLVGKVSAVSPHTAEVTLLPDPSLRVACEIETGTANPPRGILCGGSDDLLVLRHLVRDESALPRARVITSGLGGVFPRGIAVGTYLSGGEVLPSVDYSALEDVFIRHGQ